MICKNLHCNFSYHCFVRQNQERFVPPCISLKEYAENNKEDKEKDDCRKSQNNRIKTV